MPVDLVTIMIFEFSINGIGFALVGKPLISRYLERRSKVTLFLVLAVWSQLAAGIMSGVGRVLRLTGWWEVRPGVFFEALIFTVALIAVSDLFFLAFAQEVFYEGTEKGRNRIFLIIFATAVMVFIESHFCLAIHI